MVIRIIRGDKVTLVRPNLKSRSSRPSALKSALQNSLGSSRANSGGRYFLYIVYSSENCVLKIVKRVWYSPTMMVS